jgi:hypothetical protein
MREILDRCRWTGLGMGGLGTIGIRIRGICPTIALPIGRMSRGLCPMRLNAMGTF